MTAATKEEPTKTEDKGAKTHTYAILFELEGFAAEGRAATFQVLKALVREHGKTLDPVLFSRYCLHAFPEKYLPALLQTLGLSKQLATKLAEDVRNGTFMELQAKAAAVTGPLADLLRLAKQNGVALAAISAFPEDRARSLLNGVGLAEFGTQLFCFPEVEDAFPRADCWLKVAKSLGKLPVHCSVLAGSQAAAKSAISAAMNCVALPDAFTSFQDFGGVAACYDSVAELAPKELLPMLCPHLGA